MMTKSEEKRFTDLLNEVEQIRADLESAKRLLQELKHTESAAYLSRVVDRLRLAHQAATRDEHDGGGSLVGTAG